MDKILHSSSSAIFRNTTLSTGEKRGCHDDGCGKHMSRVSENICLGCARFCPSTVGLMCSFSAVKSCGHAFRGTILRTWKGAALRLPMSSQIAMHTPSQLFRWHIFSPAMTWSKLSDTEFSLAKKVLPGCISKRGQNSAATWPLRHHHQ